MKLISSSERHTLKSKALKWIIIGYRVAIILTVTKHINNKKKKKNWAWVKKEWNKVKSQEVIYQKSQKLLTSRAWSSVRTKAIMTFTITRLWNWMNTCNNNNNDISIYIAIEYSYWMFWLGSLSWRFLASISCDFWKVTFFDFIAFFPPFGQCLSIFLLFQMCFIRRT